MPEEYNACPAELQCKSRSLLALFVCHLQGLSRSAVSALHTYHAVQRVAALAHTAALLRHGASHRDAPLPPKPAAGAPVQPIEPADGMTLQVGVAKEPSSIPT